MDFQEKVSQFLKHTSYSCPPSARLLDLLSELGEVSKEYLKGSSYGAKEFSGSKDWEEELGDLLFSLCALAEETGVSLERALEKVLIKYEKRHTDKGDIGSGR